MGKKQRSLKVNLTDEEMKRIRVAAAADDKSIGDFIAEVVLARAAEILSELASAMEPSGNHRESSRASQRPGRGRR